MEASGPELGISLSFHHGANIITIVVEISTITYLDSPYFELSSYSIHTHDHVL